MIWYTVCAFAVPMSKNRKTKTLKKKTKNKKKTEKHTKTHKTQTNVMVWHATAINQ